MVTNHFVFLASHCNIAIKLNNETKIMQKLFLFFVFLFLLSCLGQTASDVYLPALPAIRETFHVTTHLMQFSIAIYMFGFSVSHLVYGPLSDSLGRKKPLIIGIVICLFGCALCRFSCNIQTFITGRFLQGAGAGAGAALFLSILRDIYHGNQLAKIGSFLAIARVLLLASSPLIGSYLLQFFGWRSCFTFLLLYATLCLFGTVFIFRETNRYTHVNKTRLVEMMQNIAAVLSSKIFLRYVFCVALAFGGILAWITTLPFLLQEVVGLTPVQFGWICAISGLFFIIGGLINALIIERFGIQKMLLIGLCVMLIGSMVMLGCGLAGKINTAAIILPIVIYIIGSSFVFANAYAGAMHPFTHTAGTAAAVFGFLQILGGAISSSIMATLQHDNQIPLAVMLLLCSGVALMMRGAMRASS